MGNVPVVKRTKINRSKIPSTFTYYGKRYKKRWTESRLETISEARRSGKDVFVRGRRSFVESQVSLSDVKLAKPSEVLRAEGKMKIGSNVYMKLDWATSKSQAKRKAEWQRNTGKYRSVRIVPRGLGIFLIYGRS